MSGAGVHTDQSRIRPSRRSDLSPRDYLEAPSRKRRLAWVRRMIASWPPAPAVEREIDCTTEDGAPTARADTGLPIDFG
jgi:hypothetical protein